MILHGRFTFSIEHDKVKLVTPNTIFSVDFVTNPPKDMALRQNRKVMTLQIS